MAFIHPDRKVQEERDAWTIADLRTRVSALEQVVESDRTKIANLVNGLKEVMKSRDWLAEGGRGCYAWDDDRYRQEFGEAIRDIRAAIEPLEKYAADLANSPKSAAEVAKARENKDKRIAEVEAEVAELRAHRDQLLQRNNITLQEKRDAEAALTKEEKHHEQTIVERDEAEAALDRLAAAIGVETEYSNLRGVDDVLADCLAELERKRK